MGRVSANRRAGECNLRYDDRPRVSLRGLWRLAKTAIFSFSTAPLAMFYGIGYASLGVFLLLGAGSVYCKLFTTWTTPGWTSQVIVASFFGAINAMGVSVLGEYVVRIYDQVRGRPSYIVGRRVGQAEPRPGVETTAGECVAELSLASQTRELATLVAAETGASTSSGASAAC